MTEKDLRNAKVRLKNYTQLMKVPGVRLTPNNTIRLPEQNCFSQRMLELRPADGIVQLDEYASWCPDDTPYNILPWMVDEIIEDNTEEEHKILLDVSKEALDAMFEILLKKGKEMKPKHYKIYDTKGKVNTTGLVYQHANNSFTDERPFVQELIAEELKAFTKVFLKFNPEVKLKQLRGKCDIELIHRLEKLAKTKEAYLEALEENPEILAVGASIYTYYYDTLRLIRKSNNHSWVLKYLTKENLNKSEMQLYFAKQTRKKPEVSIKLKDGYVVYSIADKSYSTAVKYDQKNDSFYI